MGENPGIRPGQMRGFTAKPGWASFWVISNLLGSAAVPLGCLGSAGRPATARGKILIGMVFERV